MSPPVERLSWINFRNMPLGVEEAILVWKAAGFCYSYRMVAAARILINLLENLFLLSAQLSTPLLPSLNVIIQFSINKLTRSKRKAQRMESIKGERWVAMPDLFLLFVGDFIMLNFWNEIFFFPLSNFNFVYSQAYSHPPKRKMLETKRGKSLYFCLT